MFARLQLRIDVIWCDPGRRPQHQQVIKYVGAFGREVCLVACHGGKRGLHRLFSEFLRAFLHALRNQLGGIGRGLVAGHLACGDGGEKAVQGVRVGHWRRLAWGNA